MTEQNIVYPKKFWLIPLVGWFMIIYHLFFTKKNTVIHFCNADGKNYIQKELIPYLIQLWVLLSPILIIIFWMYLMLLNQQIQ
jgi:hypothetical protein